MSRYSLNQLIFSEQLQNTDAPLIRLFRNSFGDEDKVVSLVTVQMKEDSICFSDLF